MENCNLKYIPDRLHTNNRPIIRKFNLGHLLYHRAKPEDVENPYKRVTIAELSHNLGGDPHNPLSQPQDVLFSVKNDEVVEKYEDREICTLKIISLNDENHYDKEFSQEKNGHNATGRIKLIHKPVPCMYPHCTFRVWLNGTIVTYDNYKQTLKKWNKIRTELKEELASMMIQRVVSQE